MGTCVISIGLVRGPDRALERGEVELPGRVFAYHADLDPDAPSSAGTQDSSTARAVMTRSPAETGSRRTPCPKRARFPRTRDLVPARTDLRGDGVVDIRDATLRFGRRLVAAGGASRARWFITASSTGRGGKAAPALLKRRTLPPRKCPI